MATCSSGVDSVSSTGLTECALLQYQMYYRGKSTGGRADAANKAGTDNSEPRILPQRRRTKIVLPRARVLMERKEPRKRPGQ